MSDPSRGASRVEIFALGKWRSIFIRNGTWSHAAANAVCRDVGYQTAVVATTVEFQSTEIHPFKFENIVCTGDEQSIFDCRYDFHEGAEHLMAAAVICGKTIRPKKSCWFGVTKVWTIG